MGDDLSILFDRIRLLLDEAATQRGSDPDAIELTLTEGYARALALDGERLRTEERIRELAGSDAHVGEVRILKARLTLVEEELAQLRGLLGSLSRVS
jgi:hypothetical protein